MRNFIEIVVEWKAAASMIFSASVILCAVIMLFTGEASVPVPVLASLLIVSGGGTFLQMFAFTDRIIKKMRYTIRTIVFAVPFLLLLVANAYFFQWFPIDGAMYWLMFTGIFLIIFVGGTVAFEIYFYLMGKRYDGLLGQYRKQREMEQ